MKIPLRFSLFSWWILVFFFFFYNFYYYFFFLFILEPLELSRVILYCFVVEIGDHQLDIYIYI
jgi:hypothetical protein